LLWVGDELEEEDAVTRHSAAQASFDEFVRARWDRAVRTAWVLTRDSDMAEDFAQEAFARLWERWQRISTADDPVAYLNRVLINLHLSSRRRRDVVQRLRGLGVRSVTTPDPSEEVTARAAMAEALGQLTSQQRLVLTLRYGADMSVEEIAAALDCSPGTVKTHASRGRQKLRRILQPSLSPGDHHA